MEIILRLCVALLLPLGTGYSLARYLAKEVRCSAVLSCSLGFGLGMGLLTHWMLFLHFLTYDFSYIAVPMLVSWIILLFLGRSHRPRSSENKVDIRRDSDFDMISFLLIFYLFFYLFYSFWVSLNIPLNVWDELESIAFKAKILFYERSLSGIKFLPHPSYPLQMPFSLSWVAFCLDRWHDQWVKVVIPVTFVSYLGLHYHFLRHWTTRRWSLFGVALLTLSPLLIHHTTIAYRDLTMLYFNCGTILLLLLWKNKSHDGDGYLILASLMGGFASFTKLEGLSYLFIYCFLVLIITKMNGMLFAQGLRKVCKFAVIGFGLFAFYYFYKLTVIEFPTSERIQLESLWGNLSRIPHIIAILFRNIFLSGNWCIVWILLLISLFNYPRIKQIDEIRLLLLCLGLYFGLYFFLSLLTSNYYYLANPESGLSDITTARLILHFFPLTSILIILLNCPMNSR